MASPSPPLSRAITPDFTDPDDSENDECPTASPTSRSLHESGPAPTTPPLTRHSIPQVHVAGNIPISNYYNPHPNDMHARGQKLHDYEEQLQMLEAQNKRRLMMARQEQESHVFENPHSSPPPEQEMAATKASLMARDSMNRRQQALTNLMAQEASSRKTQQRVQLQQFAISQGLKMNTEPPSSDVLQDFDFDSFLTSPRSTDTSHPDTSCGPNHSAPCNAAATNLLGSTLSNEELSQIEKNRRASILASTRQRQMMQQRMMAQAAHAPPMIGNAGNFFCYPTPVPSQHNYSIHPQVPHHVSAQIVASNTQGPPLYHSFQGVGSRVFSHPYPSPATVDGPALPKSPTKRGPSFDFSSREQEPALKKPKAAANSNDSNDFFSGKTRSLRHQRSSSVESDDSGNTDTDDEPSITASASKQGSDVSSLIEAMKKRVVEEKDTQTTGQPVEKPATQIEAPLEEMAHPSPAHSSATLDDEDRPRSPLNELQLDADMDIDQENASEIKRTEFDSGISVTTTTFKDGKTMTVMCVGDGSGRGKGKARELRQGVEIVTKTVVISGVVTTTTTTALIPMSGIEAANDEEDDADD